MSAAVLIAVAAGGAAGAVLRAAALRVQRPAAKLPYATLAVNASGSFLLGFASGAGFIDTPLAIGIGAGVLGGFTTYSTFALEAATMLTSRRVRRAAAYAVITLGLAIGLAACGSAAAEIIFKQ